MTTKQHLKNEWSYTHSIGVIHVETWGKPFLVVIAVIVLSMLAGCGTVKPMYRNANGQMCQTYHRTVKL